METKQIIEWKDLVGYEGRYIISNSGDIKRIDKYMYKSPKPFKNSYGKVKIVLGDNYKKKWYFVDMLVASTFVSNPNNYMFLKHLDGNPGNNNSSNLKWVETPDEIPCNKGEVWLDVVGYEGKYKVSNQGRVFSLTRIRSNCGKPYQGKLLKGQYHKCGYYLVMLLNGKGKGKLCKVHRLVAEAFIPNPKNKPTVDHIDGDPKNNKVENLRWATVKENIRNPNTLCHKTTIMKGGRNPMSIPVVSVDIDNGKTRFFNAASEALEELGVKDAKYIRACCLGKIDSYKGRKWYNMSDYEQILKKQ